MTDDQTRPITEPAPSPAPTTSPTPSATPTPTGPDYPAADPVGGGSRTRWLVGLGVAGLAVAATIGAVMLLGARPTPEALRYIPGDAAIVAEIRMDLPGDQLQKLGNFLSKFPGFQDQSILADKIDEALSRLVESGPGELDYRTDIKPWLAGPAYIGTSLPDSSNPSELPSPVVSATTNGGVTCATAIEGDVTTETHQGLQLTISGDGDVACVIDGRQALLGDPAAVRAGLDAKASGTGMDRNARYGTARGSLAPDQLATIYLDGAALRSAMPQASLPPEMSSLQALQDLAGAIPAWTIVGFRAEDDAFVVDSVASAEPAVPPGGAAPTAAPLSLPPTHPSALVGLLPADTILFIEHQGTGVELQNLLTKLDSIPELAPALGMLDGVGGGSELLGWIEDAGIVVLGGGGTPSGGVLVVAADEAAATQRVSTIKGLLSLVATQGGIEVTETTVAGVTVTTVVITDLGSLVPPGTIPGGGVTPSLGAPIELSFAAKGEVILLGVQGFTERVLNTPAGSSLADQATYKAATARGLGNSRASFYVGVPAAIDLIEAFVPAEALAEWQANYLPYVEPFQVVSMTSSEDESTRRSRLVVTVGQP